MAGQASGTRKDRLEAALKENLKRRKAQARAKAAQAKAEMPQNPKAREPGFEDRPQAGLKSASKTI
jgi:hypothetical protein